MPAGFTLTPGEDAKDLPITVRNTGGTRAARAWCSARLLQPDGSADQTVHCPAGGGLITCTTPQGIAPGGRATFLFRLRATHEAVTGVITGAITAGAAINVNVSVDVEVPPVNDDIELTVSTWREVFWDPRVDVLVRNRGPRPGTLKLDITSSSNIAIFTPYRDCTRTDRNAIRCVTDLEQGAKYRMSLWAFGLPHRGGSITVTASLGNATKSVTVPVKGRPGHNPVDPVDPVDPVEPPPATTTAPTTVPPTKPTVPADPTKPGTPTLPLPLPGGPTVPLPLPLPGEPTVPPPAPAPAPVPVPVPTTPPPPTSEPCQRPPIWPLPLIPDLLPWPCRPPQS
ncbi:hypothetical protein BBK82_19005 [Lentzea guizhouensis]|uniref:Uncharacterized protein n=1 Tax=Lentzea guizhouensis TaxID=1586287 RepID=A0A1B2HJG5_9PSEU|nr:hypothetical protein [Lentzea guizhouensis]ANZ37840.1 hypothetical protein BBK82_19005 [Lentzea guizhouensis]